MHRSELLLFDINVCSAASDPLHPNPWSSRGTSSAVVEHVLRSLLRVRPVEQMEHAVLEAVAAVVSVRASALFLQRGSEITLRASAGGAVDWSAFTGEVAGLVDEITGVRRLSTRILQPLGLGPHWVAALPLEQGVAALLVVAGETQDAATAKSEAARLEHILDACGIALQNALLFDRLTSLVLVDSLTGCYNRRGFDEHLRVEMVRAQRYRRPLALLVLDVDHFKQINDSLGHPGGDLVLRKVGEVMRTEFRTMDVVCRLGGDEFAVIFPETSKDEVGRLAERLRGRIAGLGVPDPLPMTLTVSVGTAGFPADASEPESLLRAADRALYRAKADGRNRVVSA